MYGCHVCHGKEDKDSKLSVTGVEFTRFGRTTRIYSNQEVILSAGTIGSPTILLRSGIGRKKHLEDIGIKVQKDLYHVGSNLKDHVCTMIGPFFPFDESGNIQREFKSFDIVHDLSISNIYNYLVHGYGPLAATGAVDAISFFDTNQLPNKTSLNDVPLEASSYNAQPNMQVHFFGLNFGTDYGSSLYHTLGMSKELWDDFVSPSYGLPGMMTLPVLLHPKSLGGNIKLSSSDPSDPPLIDPKYLSDTEDVTTLVTGIKHLLEMMDKVSIIHNSKTVKMKLLSHLLPGCSIDGLDKNTEKYEHFYRKYFKSDKYWECYVRQLTLTMYHPVGTCKMGRDPNDSVVDSKLRVHGVRGLRIADASVMPDIVSGNTNAPTIMIAEVAADLINENWSMVSNKNVDNKYRNYNEL